MNQLSLIIENQGPMLVAARAEREDRENARLLRQEQEREYQDALRQDQERDRKKREEEEAKKRAQEEVERRQREKEAREEQRRKLIAEKRENLVPEPPADAPAADVCRVGIQLPTGKRLVRRFWQNDTVQVRITTSRCHSFPPGGVRLRRGQF